ncbi:MAG: T9SS type A sorting domain-containing protein [Chitinophagales bacterium]
MNHPVYHLILALFFGFITLDSQAQTPIQTQIAIQADATPEPCGTELSTKQLKWLKEFRQQPTNYLKSADEPLYVPMQIHILGSGYEDKPYGYYPAQEAYRVLCELNDDFTGTGIQFYSAADFNYIVKAGYYSQFEVSQGLEMMSIHNFPNVINVYIVGKAAGLYGYFSPTYDGIVVIKSCIETGDNTLAHEVGHYFSLPHPFLGWENGKTPPAHQQELVDGSNCAITGDYFCDTRADFVSKRWNCPYNGKPLYDPNGDLINPDETLFMSYSYDACSSRFSDEQGEAMIGNIFQMRPYLLQSSPAGIVRMDENLLLYPESPATPVPFEHVFLSWSPVEGASEYYVEVRNEDLIVNIAPADASFYTTETSAMLTLDPYITYNWSVQPLAENIACTKAAKGKFSTTRARTIYTEDFTMEVPQCHGETGGTLQIEVAGGIAPYTYLWEDGSTESFIENITSGIYSVVVKDAKDKQNTLRFSVPQPKPVDIELAQTNYSEVIARVSGGTAPYELEWSNGMTGEIIEGMDAGIYELLVRDGNGCEQTKSIQVVDFEVVKRNLSCYGTKDGSITYSFADETPDYQFDWNIGETTAMVEGLTPAVYSVEITDGNLINIEQKFTISNPEPLHAELTIDEEGTVCATVTGGTPPYVYMWPIGITDQPCQSGLPDASLIPDPWKLNLVITDATECFLEFYPFEIPPPANGEKRASNTALELSLGDFQLFPNPAMRHQMPKLQFELNHASKVAIRVYNNMGQLMHQTQGDYDTGVYGELLEISDWNSGLYLVKIEVNGISAVERLLVY